MSGATHNLRLLILAPREVRSALRWPGVLDQAACEFCPDVYAAMARLVGTREPFAAVVVDPAHASAQVRAALELLRRHRGLAVWHLPGEAQPCALLAQLGALPVPGTLPEAGGKNGHPVVAPATGQTSRKAPARAPVPVTPGASVAPAREPVVSVGEPVAETKPAAEPVAESSVTGPVAGLYDAFSTQPVLTEAELRALLGDDPLGPSGDGPQTSAAKP